MIESLTKLILVILFVNMYTRPQLNCGLSCVGLHDFPSLFFHLRCGLNKGLKIGKGLKLLLHCICLEKDIDIFLCLEAIV
jgi:hypothetical protein